MKKLLSVVILNYNTKDLTLRCLQSIEQVKDDIQFEVIVCDNGSSDGSLEEIKATFPKVILVDNKANIGFAAGNNRARSVVQGEYVLFLNSDTEVSDGVFSSCLSYLKHHPEVGALTCKTKLPNGQLDRDARRSFPTPWVALTHFSYLDRLFPKSKLFGQYWYGYKDPNDIHEVDVLQGAFFLTRKSVLEEVNWFSEEYFLDGEDIDLSWKIKQKGYKIIYYPKVSILHIKKATKKKHKSKSVSQGLWSMEHFYRKYLWKNYPLIVNVMVIAGIQGIRILRLIKLLLPV